MAAHLASLVADLMHISHKRGQICAKQLCAEQNRINICHAEPHFGQLHIQTYGHLLGRVQLPTGAVCVPGRESRPENSDQEMIWAPHFLSATCSAEGVSLEPVNGAGTPEVPPTRPRLLHQGRGCQLRALQPWPAGQGKPKHPNAGAPGISSLVQTLSLLGREQNTC